MLGPVRCSSRAKAPTDDPSSTVDHEEVHMFSLRIRALRPSSTAALRALAVASLLAGSAAWIASPVSAQESKSPRAGALKKACQSDLDSLCSDAKGRQQMRCLREHEDKLSATCKAEVEKRKERRAQRRKTPSENPSPSTTPNP
jgi:hypothetical protein